MNEMIQTKDLCFEYQGEEQNTQVLKQMNLSIRKGEFIAVLGHNGSGKSTLAKHFNSILIPTSGTVYVEGIDTSQEELVFDVRQRVGMVFQNPDNQIIGTVVEEDVGFGPENLGVPTDEIWKRVEDSLSSVGMLVPSSIA